MHPLSNYYYDDDYEGEMALYVSKSAVWQCVAVYSPEPETLEAA